ncbi:MAG: hypothetical protein ACOX9R_16295, partial [Armatimonadota bacterium]
MKLAALMAGWAALGAPAIDFEVAQLTVPRSHEVRLELSATGEGVEVGSYGVRTRDSGGEPLPGLLPRGEHAFVPAGPEDAPDRHLFLDNERGDLDPREGRLALQIDVSEWPDGEHWFIVFACNRPAEGRYVQDTRTLRVETLGGRVVEERTAILESLSVTIGDFGVEPPVVAAGEPVRLSLSFAESGVGDLVWEVTVPYWIEEHETPPGWRYDAEAQKASLTADVFADNRPPDEDPAEGAIALTVATDGWEPGVRNFTLRAAPSYAPGQTLAYRDFAITVRPEQPRFEVEFAHDLHLRGGTHFGNIVSPEEGVAIAYNQITRDGGITWEGLDRGVVPGINLLADGTVMGMATRSRPIEGRPGYYAIEIYESTDGGETFE